jgi:hypothetical protein
MAVCGILGSHGRYENDNLLKHVHIARRSCFFLRGDVSRNKMAVPEGVARMNYTA